MIIENQATDLEDGITECAHKIEIVCASCGRDVSQDELDAMTCNDCGASLESVSQSVEIHATSIPMIGITF